MSNNLYQLELPYTEDASVYFNRIRHLEWPCWLDSGQPNSQQGRYDILTANPQQKLVHYSGEQTVCPFAALDELHSTITRPVTSANVPFVSGLLGFLSYDLGRDIETLPTIAKNELNLPLLVLGLYDFSIVIDHQEKTSMLSHLPYQGNDRWQALQVLLQEKTPEPLQFTTTSPITSNLSYAAYEQKFNQIQHHLRMGDAYQINFAQRFQASFKGSAYALYEELRQENPMPFSAYLNYPFVELLSLSPERLISLKGNQIETKPIKGTLPRGQTEAEDNALAEKLMQSEKDRAENVMIVDLLRNDLSKCAKPHSVKTPKVCALESFSSVHHLVSTVQAELKDTVSIGSLLKAVFPGGSITGAPKIRAMQIIENLEPHRRDIFCGAIGYINEQGNADFNIAIRTLAAKSGECYFWAGGGIVVDSEAESEYQETIDKVTPIIKIIESHYE